MCASLWYSFLDLQDPVFMNLPPSMEVYADPLETTAQVSWEPPTVVDQEPNLQATQVAGPSPQSVLREDIYLVVYRAVDSAGNAVEYAFNITVKGKLSIPKSEYYLPGY